VEKYEMRDFLGVRARNGIKAKGLGMRKQANRGDEGKLTAFIMFRSNPEHSLFKKYLILLCH
jgi:hypothetical protein